MANGRDFNDSPFFDGKHLKYLFFSWEGRINRQRFWLGYLFIWFIEMVALLIGTRLITAGSNLSIISGIIIAVTIIVIVGTIATVMLYIKRAHDRDHRGWYFLLLLIPLIGIIWYIELAFFSGTAGDNEYGADPRP